MSINVLKIVCTNGLVLKNEKSSTYRHVSTKILNEFPEVIEKVSGELAGKRDQFRLSIEKEAVEWAWPMEAGDTLKNFM